MIRSLLLGGALLGSVVASAQFQGAVYAENPQIPVSGPAGPRRAAWAGGYNTPNVAMADLNHDGRADLVVFEPYRLGVKTFINTAASGPAQYQYSPAYAKNFPHISQYLYLLDYNCDGIADLFHQGGNGVTTPALGYAVHRGYYENDTLKFQFYKDLKYYLFNGWINAYSGNQDVPGIADIDGDGDLDFVSYGVGGTLIEFYRNRQVEDGLKCDSIRINLISTCWGRIAQSGTRVHQTAVPNSFCYIDSMARPGGNSSASNPALNAKTTIHGNNAICLVDMEGDGDMDVLDGNIFYPEIQYLQNGKANYSWVRDTIVAQDTTWQSGGTILKLPYYPMAQHIDADGDGKRDLLFTPRGPGYSKNYDNFYLYKNTGTVTQPQFTFERQDFLQNVSLDMGSNSYPLFYDYNRDGKQDLLVGSTGLWDSSGQYRGQLMYLQNTSTVGNPGFSLQTDNFLNLSPLHLAGIAPAIGDLDKDGKDDLILGHSDGTLSFIKNTAATAAAQPVWTSAPVSLAAGGSPIDVGEGAAPAIYDLNKDGRPDLIVGKQNGMLNYYQSNAGAGIQLQLADDSLGLVKADPRNMFVGFSTPFFGKLDNTGITYLLSGSATGALYRFDGFQAGSTTAPFARIDTIYSELNVGGRTAPAVADVDGDGAYDMVVGNALGGVKLYRQVKTVTAGIQTAGKESGLEIFPNPAASVAVVRWQAGRAGQGTLRVVSMAGQTVWAQPVRGTDGVATIPVAEMASGVYTVLLEWPAGRSVSKLSILK